MKTRLFVKRIVPLRKCSESPPHLKHLFCNWKSLRKPIVVYCSLGPRDAERNWPRAIFIIIQNAHRRRLLWSIVPLSKPIKWTLFYLGMKIRINPIPPDCWSRQMGEQCIWTKWQICRWPPSQNCCGFSWIKDFRDLAV